MGWIEGKFGLAGEDATFKLSNTGTDLIRHPALLAPEFELSQYEAVTYPIERCTCYDVGTRSFAFDEYLKDVIDYWEELSQLDDTLESVYHERWPEEEYSSLSNLIKAKREIWRGVAPSTIEILHKRYQKRWSSKIWKQDKGTATLRTLASRRVAELKRLFS